MTTEELLEKAEKALGKADQDPLEWLPYLKPIAYCMLAILKELQRRGKCQRKL